MDDSELQIICRMNSIKLSQFEAQSYIYSYYRKVKYGYSYFTLKP